MKVEPIVMKVIVTMNTADEIERNAADEIERLRAELAALQAHPDEVRERVAEVLRESVTTYPADAETEERERITAAVLAVIPAVRPARDGYEWVELPTATVDYYAGAMHTATQAMIVTVACRAAVAARPPAVPQIEWVPWWEAVGRKLASGQEVVRAERTAPQMGRRGATTVTTNAGWNLAVTPDGLVEVLDETGSRTGKADPCGA